MNKIVLFSYISLFLLSSLVSLSALAGSELESDKSCETLLAAGDYAKAAEAGRQGKDFSSAMCLGKALNAQDKHDDAYQVFADAEKLATDGFRQVMAVIYQARAKRDAGQAEQAYGLYQHGYELATSNKIKQGQRVCLNEPGQMRLDAHDPKAALERFQQAYPFSSNDNERAESNELIASAYRQLLDYDHAIEHQLRATIQEQSSGELNHYLYATLELAAIRTESKDFSGAQKNIDEALQQSRSANSAYWEADSLLYQGRLEKAKGDTGKAKDLFNQAAALAAKVGEPSLIKEISQELK
jgi:tetratricopeptide (TPR) repeat protein